MVESISLIIPEVKNPSNPSLGASSVATKGGSLDVIYRVTMVKFWLLHLIILFSGSLCQGAMEIVAREMFQGGVTLDSGNPGNLGTWIEGAWKSRKVGPSLETSSNLGWSGDAQGQYTRTMWDLTQAPYSSARSKGMIGCWVRFESFEAAGYLSGPLVANPTMVLQLTLRSDNWPFQLIGVTRDGSLASRENDSWVSRAVVQEKTWYWMQVEWEGTETQFSAKSSYQPLGGELTELSVHTTTRSYQANHAYVMNAPYTNQMGAYYTWRGRLGAAVLAKIDAMGDGGQMHDVTPPTEERHTWYLDPANGHDENDGDSPERAWKTVSKVNEESSHAGMLSPLEGGYDAGDILIVDTSQAPLDLGAQSWVIKTAGLNVRPARGQKKIFVKAHKDISGPETVWTPYQEQGYPNVWMTTDLDAQDLCDVVVWQDDLWLNHPTGPSVASVIDSINETPGSFYSDGTTLYLHPFGSSNPNTDGKTYTRSRFREQGQSAIMLLAPDLYVEGLDVQKTTLAGAADNLPYSAYGIQGDHSFGGRTVLKNCYVSYAGKHCIGFSDSGSNRDVWVERCQVEQGTPYSNQTPWVDYNGNAEASGNQTTYYECLNLKPAGLIGSKEGRIEETASYTSHNNGSGTQFSRIQFIGGVHSGIFSATSCIDEVFLERVKLGGGFFAANEVTVTRCVMNQLPITTGWGGGSLIARHNLFIAEGAILNAGFSVAASGTLIYEGNTFDLRPYRQSNTSTYALFNRVTPLAFTFRNNVFIAPQDLQFNVLENAYDSDELTFSNNFYEMGQQGLVVARFHEGASIINCTLAQWQARGHDQDSFVGSTDLDERYIPALDSSLKAGGIDLGKQPDFSGRIFGHRSSIGAYEPVESFEEWQSRLFESADLDDLETSAADADPDHDGLDNGLEFVLGRDPLHDEGAFYLTTNFDRENAEIVFEFERSALTASVSLGLECSEDLDVWRPELEISTEDMAFDAFNGKVLTRLRYEVGLDSTPRLFFRVKPFLE